MVVSGARKVLFLGGLNSHAFGIELKFLEENRGFWAQNTFMKEFIWWKLLHNMDRKNSIQGDNED